MVCQAHVKCSSVLWAYAGHLAVTCISAEDDGLLLKVDRMGDQGLIKLENGVTKITPSKRMFQNTEEMQARKVKLGRTASPAPALVLSLASRQWLSMKTQKLNEPSGAASSQAKQFVKKHAATYWPLRAAAALAPARTEKMCGERDVLFLTDE